jgi:sarcosine oxidase subunit beta
MTGRSDAVVIGAGIVGCSVAFALAQRGHKVTVLDSGPGVAAGTTSSSSAVIRFHYSYIDGVTLALESAHMWSQWSDVTGETEPLARFYQVGAVVYETPLLSLERLQSLFDTAGVAWEFWDAETARQRCAELDPRRFGPPAPVESPAFFADPDGELACLWTPQGGFVDDPQLAAVNLANAARRLGAVFRFRQKVVAIPGDGRVSEVILASGERVAAEIVVNCAGPWSSQIVEMAGVADEMGVRTRPLRQEVHVVDAPDGFTVETGGMCVTDADLGTYFRPHLGGTLLIGGLEPACDEQEWIDDPDSYSTTASVHGYESNVYRAARRMPALRVPSSPRGLASAYDVTDDWTPIYDKTSRPGFYLAIGTSGNQFKNAPMIGPIMSALIAASDEGRDHDIDPLRFHLPQIDRSLDLGHFSRLRAPHHSSGSVVG